MISMHSGSLLTESEAVEAAEEEERELFFRFWCVTVMHRWADKGFGVTQAAW